MCFVEFREPVPFYSCAHPRLHSAAMADKKKTLGKASLCGGATGATEALLLFPAEFVKTQLQLEVSNSTLNSLNGINRAGFAGHGTA